MKSLLAVVAILAATAAVSSPAVAAERYRDAGPATVIVIDRGYGDRYDGYRDHDRGYGRHDRDRWSDRRAALSERQVAYRLMRRGFVRIDDIDRYRGRYTVRAVRPDGERVRLTVDAYDGGILARERIGWTARGGRGVSHGEGYGSYHRPVGGPVGGVEYGFGGGVIGFYTR